MSTLTESPSPAASPPRPSQHALQFQSPQRQSSKSPRLSFQPSVSRSQAIAATPPKSPRTQSLSSIPTHQYTDAATQYSPDGLPPTAAKSRSATNDTVAASNKRKSTSPIRLMNSSSANSTTISQSPAARTKLEEEVTESVASPASTLPSRLQRQLDVGATTDDLEAAPKRPRTGSHPAKIMPRKYETCNVKDLGLLIANMLMELIRLNDQIPLRDGRLTRFHSRAPPGISCHDYLLRLIQHATLSPPILLSMVYYIDRLCALYPAFTISSLTVHRFLITSATVAAKGLSDSFWTNPTYARIGGISTSELATLEMDFLQRVEWRIVPKPEVLVDYYNSLVERSEGYALEDAVQPDTDADIKMEDDPP